MAGAAFDRERAVTWVVFCALSALAAAMPVHNDTWWHLRSGQDTLAGFSPFVDRYSWTVHGGFVWNHSWLAQAILFLAYELGGLPVTTALCASLAVGGWFLVWRQCRGRALERVLLLGVALPTATITWSVRPQAFSILLLPVVVMLVARNQWLVTALVLALWANLHAGFVFGVIVLAAGVVAAVVWDRARLLARLGVALLGTVATLGTPLGWGNWQEIVLSVQRSHANQIVEWQPPAAGGNYVFFWLTAAAVVVLLPWKWRQLDSPYTRISACAALLGLVFAAQSMRHVPAFMMLALPPLSVWSFGARVPATRHVEQTRGPEPRLLTSAALVSTGAIIGLLYARPLPSMDWTPLSAGTRKAIAECSGPLFNAYGLGGPIIWFVPTQPVFVDSRQDPYPTELVQDAMRVEDTGQFQEVFARYGGVNCAALPASSPAVAALADADWRIHHRDDRWAVLESPRYAAK